VDALMDMARTSLNLLGNCLTTVVLAQWEGEFVLSPEPEPADADDADGQMIISTITLEHRFER
jgi:Na+/H+-dicarboxylate symporters